VNIKVTFEQPQVYNSMLANNEALNPTYQHSKLSSSEIPRNSLSLMSSGNKTLTQ